MMAAMRPPLAAGAILFGTGAAFGTALTLAGKHLWSRACCGDRREQQEILVFELKGEYYQCLGHAWDHEVKDFKVVYRPLYHCTAADGRFESHHMAVSHFSRWESKFARLVDLDELPTEIASRLLPGPFWYDAAWTHPRLTRALPPGCTSRSGLGSRSHEPPLLEHVIGDYRGFIDLLHGRLLEAGLDPLARKWEMDHICYRCSSVRQYMATVQALVPELGETLVEGMIGGR